jgi:hypothetical protein
MLSMRSGIVLALAASFIASSGCGGSRLHPVKGKVTLAGKPMKGGGSIGFVPLGKQEGKAPGGEIDADGNYVLTTTKPGDGSMTGEFRVVIQQVVEQEPEMTSDGSKAAKAVVAVPVADRIPLIYCDPHNSPLMAKVEAKDNVIDFDLKKDAGSEFRPPGAFRGFDLRHSYAQLGR